MLCVLRNPRMRNAFPFLVSQIRNCLDKTRFEILKNATHNRHDSSAARVLHGDESFSGHLTGHFPLPAHTENNLESAYRILRHIPRFPIPIRRDKCQTIQKRCKNIFLPMAVAAFSVIIWYLRLFSKYFRRNFAIFRLGKVRSPAGIKSVSKIFDKQKQSGKKVLRLFVVGV